MSPEKCAIRRKLGLTDNDNRLRLKPHINLDDMPKVDNYGLVLRRLPKIKVSKVKQSKTETV